MLLETSLYLWLRPRGRFITFVELIRRECVNITLKTKVMFINFFYFLTGKWVQSMLDNITRNSDPMVTNALVLWKMKTAHKHPERRKNFLHCSGGGTDRGHHKWRHHENGCASLYTMEVAKSEIPKIETRIMPYNHSNYLVSNLGIPCEYHGHGNSLTLPRTPSEFSVVTYTICYTYTTFNFNNNFI